MPKVEVDFSQGNYVPPSGPEDAKIAIVGEAPGKDEVRKGEPFIGSSGRLLNQLLDKAGINRYNCYLTNVMKYRPPANNFKYFYDGTKPSQELLQGARETREELQRVNPDVIIAAGGQALRALTGEYDRKISSWRGSIIESDLGYIVPTYHPAYIMRVWKLNPILIFDLRRAKKLVYSEGVDRLERTLYTDPTLSMIEAFIEECKKSDKVSFDIETHTLENEEWVIDTIGLAYDAKNAMSIPIGEEVWSVEEEVQVLRLVAEVLGDSSIKKIAQNGQYDAVFLEWYGVPVNNLWFDTMCASKVLYPEFPKGLDFLVSLYTKEPHYKHTIDTERQKYNAKDAACTYEVAEGLLEDMKDFNVYEFYRNHVHPLIRIYLEAQQLGVKLDEDRKEIVQDRVESDIEDLRDRLKELTGEDINVYSVTDMRGYIYDKLGLSERFNDNGNLDTSKDTLKYFYRKTGREEFKVMIDLRKARSKSSTYLSVDIHEDGRIRSFFDVSGTETGRLSSRKTVDDKGMNMQNVDKAYRDLIRADDGFCFLSADLSQAENRIVAYVSEDQRMIDVVEGRIEGETDVHRANAALLFGKKPQDITPDERQDGKRITHGCLTEDHEVLSTSGWKPITDVESGDRIACFDTRLSGFLFDEVEPVKESCKTELYRMHNGDFDIMMTEDHNVVWQRSPDEGFETSSFSDTEFNFNSRIPTASYYEGEFISEEDEKAARIACYLAVTGTPKYKDMVQLEFERLVDLKRFQRIVGLKLDYTQTGEKFYIIMSVDPIEKLEKYFQYEGGHHLKWDILNTSMRIRKQIFTDLSALGYDGELDFGGWHNADVLQALCHFTGKTAIIEGTERDSPRLRFVDENHVKADDLEVARFPEGEDVYCVESPTGAFLVRRNGKVSVTGNSNYRMGPRTFAKFASIPVSEAKKKLKKYHDTYPKVRAWHKEIDRKLRQDRTLINPFGRKRYFNDRFGGTLSREATAYLPQSSVADCMHRATKNIHARIPHPARVVLQIHDEIVIQCPDDDETVKEVSKIIEEELERPFEIDGKEISIPTEVERGHNWKEVS